MNAIASNPPVIVELAVCPGVLAITADMENTATWQAVRECCDMGLAQASYTLTGGLMLVKPMRQYCTLPGLALGFGKGVQQQASPSCTGLSIPLQCPAAGSLPWQP